MKKTCNSDEKTRVSSNKLQVLNKALKEAVFIAFIQLLVYSPAHAQHKQKQPLPTRPKIQVSDKEILKKSQVAYRAEGGFTGVISYGVIIGCVEGKISVLKSIHDPKLVDPDHKKFELGSMTHEKYLNLWHTMEKMNVFGTNDIPDPKLDIMDEFTFTFNVKVGDKENQFRVFGIDRSEASRHFAFKSIIDKTTDMDSFWNSEPAVAQKPTKIP